jgi:hypothetical protein
MRGATRRGVWTARRAFVGLLDIDRGVRPQTETTAPAPVIKDPLRAIQFIDGGPYLFLARGVGIGQGAAHRFRGGQEIVVEQVQEPDGFQDFQLDRVVRGVAFQ